MWFVRTNCEKQIDCKLIATHYKVKKFTCSRQWLVLSKAEQHFSSDHSCQLGDYFLNQLAGTNMLVMPQYLKWLQIGGLHFKDRLSISAKNSGESLQRQTAQNTNDHWPAADIKGGTSNYYNAFSKLCNPIGYTSERYSLISPTKAGSIHYMMGSQLKLITYKEPCCYSVNACIDT